MSKSILIELIKTDRKLEPGDDIADLANLISGFGLKVPVLLDQDYNLVDGLRRIEAMKLLGETKVPAVVADMYEEAIANLKLAHQDRDGVGPKRTRQIELGIEDLRIARTSRLRARYANVPIGKRGTIPKELRTRDLFQDAMNDVNAPKYAQIYRQAEAGVMYAQELVDALEAGEMGISTAISRLEERRRTTGDVHTLPDQRALLHGATRGLSGLVKGLDKMGSPVKLSKAELEPILKELKAHRAKLASFIRYIEKESKGK